MNGDYPNYKWVSLLAIAVNSVLTIHFLLCKKYKRLSLYFAEAQTILANVSIIEYAIIGNPSYSTVDLLPTALVLISSVSHFSYN